MEGPLNNLQPSMIQFSKPRRTLVKAMDQFRRHETSARDYLGNGSVMGDGALNVLGCYLLTSTDDHSIKAGDPELPAVSMRVSTAPTMRWAIFRPTCSRSAPRQPTLRGFPCLLLPVRSVRVHNARMARNAAHTAATQALSSHRTPVPQAQIPRASLAVRSAHRIALEEWRIRNLIDCSVAHPSHRPQAPRTWAACRSTTTSPRTTGPI